MGRRTTFIHTECRVRCLGWCVIIRDDYTKLFPPRLVILMCRVNANRITIFSRDRPLLPVVYHNLYCANALVVFGISFRESRGAAEKLHVRSRKIIRLIHRRFTTVSGCTIYVQGGERNGGVGWKRRCTIQKRYEYIYIYKKNTKNANQPTQRTLYRRGGGIVWEVFARERETMFGRAIRTAIVDRAHHHFAVSRSYAWKKTALSDEI